MPWCSSSGKGLPHGALAQRWQRLGQAVRQTKQRDDGAAHSPTRREGGAIARQLRRCQGRRWLATYARGAQRVSGGWYAEAAHSVAVTLLERRQRHLNSAWLAIATLRHGLSGNRLVPVTIATRSDRAAGRAWGQTKGTQDRAAHVDQSELGTRRHCSWLSGFSFFKYSTNRFSLEKNS
jgi:hypothetical protein